MRGVREVCDKHSAWLHIDAGVLRHPHKLIVDHTVSSFWGLVMLVTRVLLHIETIGKCG
jgi:hypothetical protein